MTLNLDWEHNLRVGTCKVCGEEYIKQHGNQTICSNECHKLNYSRYMREYFKKRREKARGER